MSQQENPYLTITLTGAQPVKIKKDDWPVIASAEDKNFDNQYEFQANRKATWKLTVRQHADGRTIVYATYIYFGGANASDIRGGKLIQVPNADADSIGDAEPIIAAIQDVGREIEERMPDDDGYGPSVFPRLVHECIADLPAVEL